MKKLIGMIIFIILIILIYVIYSSYKENQFKKSISRYIDYPTESNLLIIDSLSSNEDNKNYFRENMYLTATLVNTLLDNSQYEVAEKTLRYIPVWIPSIAFASETDLNSPLPYRDIWPSIGLTLSNIDNHLLSDALFDNKMTYLIERRSIKDFYFQNAKDIAKRKTQSANYIKTIFSFLGCNQELLVWKEIKGNIPSYLRETSINELPIIKEIDEKLYFKNLSKFKNGELPDMSEQCSLRMENLGETILLFPASNANNKGIVYPY